MTLEQIIEETRQLPTDVVAELVDRILLERHGGIEPEIEAASAQARRGSWCRLDKLLVPGH